MIDPLLLAEHAAKAVCHVANYTANAIAEARTGFSEAEAGDWLDGRMECAGPDTTQDVQPIERPTSWLLNKSASILQSSELDPQFHDALRDRAAQFAAVGD